jgi:hypothetical protein
MNIYTFTIFLHSLFMALLQPFVILFVCGHIISVSTWLTELQPLFIITNIMISFLFLHTKRWTLPAILLIIFSVEFYPIFHTWLLSYFLCCLYPILREANLVLHYFIFIGITNWLLLWIIF